MCRPSDGGGLVVGSRFGNGKIQMYSEGNASRAYYD